MPMSWSFVGLWIVKILLFAIICFFFGWLGLRVLDALTPRIHERQEIGEDPRAIGLFICGFLIYVGLVIHGAVTTLPGGAFAGVLVMRRLGLIVVIFTVGLLLAVGIFNLLDRLTPRIPFRKIRQSPLGTGVYVFGYFIFLGLLTHAAFSAAL